jgi:DNA polymerase I-like protein with 3'-5' exonuclease and polymerase domains
VGFKSGDPSLIKHFTEGTDIYIHTAKQYLGEDGWNKLDKAHKKMWRKHFKQLFLALLYGMQERLLSEKLSVDIPTARKLRETVLSEYPKLKEYVESQQSYPFDESRNSAPKMGCWGPGTINTFFGDRLYLREWDYLKKAKDERERNSIKAKIQRLAVNLVVQGGTSTAINNIVAFGSNIKVKMV